MEKVLRWRPETEGHVLPKVLFDILSERYCLNEGQHVFHNDDEVDMAFLDGLVAARVDGAGELREAVRKYETVVIWDAWDC